MGNTRNVVGSPDVLFDILLIMRRRCQDKKMSGRIKLNDVI